MNRLLAYRSDLPLSTGLRLLIANKRLLLWTYLASVLLGLRAALPFHSRVSPILDHSLAAQDLAGRFDVSSYALLTMHLGRQGTTLYTQAFADIVVYCVFAILLAAGTYFVFGSGEVPRLGLVLRAGVDYFWRFFRLLLFAGIIAGMIVGGLTAVRTLVLKHADEVYVGRTYFYLALISLVAVALVAFFFRLWFDLAEAMTIQLGLDGDRRVRRSLFPSLRILKQRFASTYLSYLLIGALGWAGLLLCGWLWVVAVPARAVPLAWIVGQLGVLSILTARIWQRGLATAVVAFAEPVPVVHRAIFTPPPAFQTPEAGEENSSGILRMPNEISSSEVPPLSEAIGEPGTAIDSAPHPIDDTDLQT
ncbi:MAG TPA: hypothetical protein VFN53_13975 [Acidobacteriaceae bacterium]|nr:hypothetical protein [Acidobacteriaceae bacterium]